MDILDKAPEGTTPTPYSLPLQTKAKLLTWVDKNCWECQGTGVKGWKHDGREAIVCRCVDRGLARAEAAAAELRAKVEQALVDEARKTFDEVKAKQERPMRPCMACQKVSESDGHVFLTPSHAGSCEHCKDQRMIPLTDEEWVRQIAWKRFNESVAAAEKEAKDALSKADGKEPVAQGGPEGLPEAAAGDGQDHGVGDGVADPVPDAKVR